MSHVYVIGHRNPDTDSICSVIGYTAFLNQNEPDRYIPTRCGEVNPESAFALETFGMEAPVYIESVEPNVSDLPFTYLLSAGSDVPTIEVVSMMDTNDVRNMPITDNDGQLVGLISEHGLARAYVTRQSIEQLSIAPTRPETLARILNAEIIVPSESLLEGRVYISIDALHVTLSRLTDNDVAIVGDNEPAQLALISAGIAALIIADAAPVGERVINAAQAREVGILSTALDAFGVGKMINLSLPAREVMATDVPTVRRDDTIAYAKQLVSNSRYRTACVVDDEKHLLGMISRNTFLENVQKQVILLDHNEYSQAVDGIENADILEIIDHHRLGSITTLRPIRFMNDPVGSTSTIIAQKFMDAGITPSKEIAGLLLSGILSDTLVLRISTTTNKDHRAVEYLSEIAGVDPVEYGTKLIGKGMELEGIPMQELLNRDMKRYTLFGHEVLIAQVMVPTFDYCTGRGAEIKEEMAIIKAGQGVEILVALFTSVFDSASLLFAVADSDLLAKTGIEEQPTRLDNVMSRKNDFLPRFGQMLRNI